MKFVKIRCEFRCGGEMKAEYGRRGYYYRCEKCKKCINRTPERVFLRQEDKVHATVATLSNVAKKIV